MTLVQCFFYFFIILLELQFKKNQIHNTALVLEIIIIDTFEASDSIHKLQTTQKNVGI